MPNRMLRDWTASDKINSVCVHSERFFTRLIMKVDDYGSFPADTRLLKANLYPLLLDNIREADLLRWMAACQKAELIVLYEVNNKKYLQIVDFGQRLDRAKAKYPKPPIDNELPEIKYVMRAIANLPQESAGNYPPEVEVEVEVEVEKEVEGESAKAQHTPDQIAYFKKFCDWINENTPRVNGFKHPFTIDEYLRLLTDYDRDFVKKILLGMENWADLTKKNLNANLTFRKWAARDNGFEQKTPTTSGPSAAELKAERILKEVG